MAATVLTDAYVSIDATVITNATASVAISYSAEAPEVGIMGQRQVTRFGGGQVDWGVEMELTLDEATHGALLFGLMGDEVDLEIRPTSGAIATGNPAYRGKAILTSFNPLGSGEFGEVVTASLSFVGADTLTRVTSGS